MTIRGKKIDNTLFGVVEVADAEPVEESRGRDAQLIAARNEHLLYRYMWYRMRRSLRGAGMVPCGKWRRIFTLKKALSTLEATY